MPDGSEKPKKKLPSKSVKSQIKPAAKLQSITPPLAASVLAPDKTPLAKLQISEPRISIVPAQTKEPASPAVPQPVPASVPQPLSAPAKIAAAPPEIPVAMQQQTAPVITAAPKIMDEGPKKDDTADLVSGPIKEYWAYIKANYRSTYLEFLKIDFLKFFAVLSIYALMALLIFGAIFGLGGVQVIGSGLEIVAVIVLLLVLGSIVLTWLSQSIGLTSLVFTDSEFSHKPFGIVDAFHSIKGRTFRYIIIDMIIKLVLSVPGIAILLLPWFTLGGDLATAGLAIMAAYMIFLIYYLIVYSIYGFFMQFWVYGFIVEGLPVFESMKKSIRLARAKFFETLIFDIVFYVLMMVASIPLVVFFFIAYILLLFFLFALVVLPLVGIVLLVAFILVMIVLSVFFVAVVDMVRVQVHYLYWKRIK